MRIRLIQPRMHRRPMDSELKLRMAPHLGLLTLAALTPEEHAVELVNENIDRHNFDKPVELVAVTVTVEAWPRALEIARKYQQRGIPVIAGGIHITSVPDSAAEFFDAICVGPAEPVWPQILADAEAGNLRPRYSTSDIISGAELAVPDYKRFDLSGYLYSNVMTTSRSCPFACDFCYNSCEAVRGAYIHNDVNTVIAEIRKMRTRHIMFIDDNFIGYPAYTHELLEAMRPLNLKWSAAVSANILHHPVLLDLMRDSGCQSLFVGFESLNPTALAGVHKKQNTASSFDALVDALHNRGIMINASFVFGLDGDTPEVFRHTIDWVVSKRIETVTSHILTPYPGTKLYRAMHDAGRITDFDLAHYDTSHVVFRPAQMSAQQLLDGYLQVYRELYSFRNILRRLPRVRHQIMPYLLFNICYRKYGNFTSRLCRAIGFERIGRMARLCAYHLR